jgi:hypothetical protein
MSRVIVIEFVSLDGVVQDPDGSEGSRQGGWAFACKTAPCGLRRYTPNAGWPLARVATSR